MKSSFVTRRQFLKTTVATGVGGTAISLLPSTVSAQTVGSWQIACYTRPWSEHSYLVALDAIAEAGFKYAGLMTQKGGVVISPKTTVEEAMKIGEEVRRRGLGLPSIWGGGLPVAISLEAGIAAMRRLIDCCKAAGAGNVLMGGTGREELAGLYYKAIAENCGYAQENGVGISVKPHGGSNSTGPQCRKLIEEVGHKNFRLWYDPGNIFFYSKGQLDPVDDSKTVDGLVVGMSVKDYRAPKDVALTPGTGQVDFRTVLRNLKRGGFTRGPLVVETLKPGTLDELAKEAVAARRFVEELVAS